jgi:hypothetical protein
VSLGEGHATNALNSLIASNAHGLRGEERDRFIAAGHVHALLALRDSQKELAMEVREVRELLTADNRRREIRQAKAS